MAKRSEKLSFTGDRGQKLAARMDFPESAPKAYVLFAHCFTCSKDIFAASRIAGEMADQGFAVLRFDFTGLGASEGEFENTNFSSNVADLICAVDYLREHYEVPQILVGHSLGGAAVLSAAGHIDEVRAVATIGAPADADHVVHNFGAKLDEIEQEGIAEVQLAGRPFTIKKQFLEDLEQQTVLDNIAGLRKALIVFHAPLDDVVGIDNAAKIFQAAKHPKSFVSLDKADHLLSRKEDAVYVAKVLSAWATRYLPDVPDGVEEVVPDGVVVVAENGRGRYQQDVLVGKHKMIADEPSEVGGNDAGPKPHDFVAAGLGACTSMTLRMYAERKKLDLTKVTVDVRFERRAVEGEGDKTVPFFDREILLEGNIDQETRNRMMQIADMCPVHKTLSQGARITTKLKDS